MPTHLPIHSCYIFFSFLCLPVSFRRSILSLYIYLSLISLVLPSTSLPPLTVSPPLSLTSFLFPSVFPSVRLFVSLCLSLTLSFSLLAFSYNLLSVCILFFLIFFHYSMFSFVSSILSALLFLSFPPSLSHFNTIP